MRLWLILRRHRMWCARVAVVIAMTVFARPRGEEVPSGELARERKYIEVIQSLDQTWRSKGQLSPQELKLYVDTYYLYGEGLLKKGDAQNARACFLRVISLDRRHANSYYQLGMIEKEAKNYQKALPYLRTSISLRSLHSPEANKAVLEIAKECLASAEKAMDEGEVATARAYLDFVIANFVGEDRNKALDLATYRLTLLTRAASEFNRAARLLSAGSRDDGVKMLRGIAGSYPDTFFARRANQVLEKLGEKIIVVRTATGLQLPPAWKRKETPHFEVYYEKEIFFNRIAPAAEKVLPRIFALFGYPKPTWDRKCKIYLFSNLSDWKKFLATNKGKVLEWYEAFAIEHAMEIYLYETRDTSEMVESILPHELTHVVLHSVVGDVSHTPLWFQEGLAQLHDEPRKKNAQRMIPTLRRTSAYIPLEELVSLRGYPAETEKVSTFYMESLALVNLFFEKFGGVKIREMALAFRQPVSFEFVLQKVFGMTFTDLEKLWKKNVE
jgi:tetratricopeptide (TPR) repeat protein